MTDIEAGTIIRATMKVDDVIPALYHELKRIDPEAAAYELQAGMYAEEINEALHGSLEETTKGDPEMMQWASEAQDRLVDRLNEHGPGGLVFGVHPGDGSDLGWWPREFYNDYLW